MLPKQSCIDCHYFCKQYRDDSGVEHKLEVTKEEREKSRDGNFFWQIHDVSLGCHKGVWDQGLNFPKNTEFDVICKENRRGRCYFWKHTPGAFMQAVEDLQERKNSQRDSSKMYRLAIYTLLVTIAGLAYQLWGQ